MRRLEYRTTRKSYNNTLPKTSLADLQEVTVLVSQHSSLDRDQYILYQSSLSISASSPLAQRPDPGLAGSPSSLEAYSSDCSWHEKVIPDSQSITTSSCLTVASVPPASNRKYSLLKRDAMVILLSRMLITPPYQSWPLQVLYALSRAALSHRALI